MSLTTPSNHPRRAVFALGVIAFLVACWLIFGGLGGLPLITPDEARNAEVAREMNLSGAWLVPTYDDLPYLDKPAFFFRTVAWCFHFLGENEAAARLPSALFALGVLTMTVFFCRAIYAQDELSAATGPLAVLIIGTTPLFLGFARLVIVDMTLTFFVCAAVFAGFLAERADEPARARWYLAATAAAGCATLVKGPVGFFLPLLVLGVFHLVNGTGAAIRRFFAIRHIALFFAITLPWFIGVNLHRPDFAYYGLIHETFRRFTTNEFHRAGPIYYYAPWVAGGFFPWSLFLPGAMLLAWRRRGQLAAADKMLIVWCIVVVLFFSLSKSKRPDYILSAMVAAGILTARLCLAACGNPSSASARVLRCGAALLGAAALLTAVLLGAELAQPGILARLLSLHRDPILRFDFNTPVFVATLIAIAVVSIFSWRKPTFAPAAFAALPLLVLTLAFGRLEPYAEGRSERQLAAALPPLPPSTTLASWQSVPMGLPFYHKQAVALISVDGREFPSNYIPFMLGQTHPWPDNVVPLAEARAWLAAHAPVYLLSQAGHLSDLQAIAAVQHATVNSLGHGWWGALLAQ